MSPRQRDEPSIKILAEKALCYPRAFAEGLSHVFQSNRHSGDFLIMPLACASNKTWTNSRADFILCLKMADFSYHKKNHFSPTHDFILLGSKMLSLFCKQSTEHYVYSAGKKKRIQSDSDLTVKLIEELTFTWLQLFMKRLAHIHFSKEHYVPVN